jgi:hypothetical protein
MPNILEVCGDCDVDLKQGEAKTALDGTILCADCKEAEMENEDGRENEDGYLDAYWEDLNEIEEIYQESMEGYQD